MKKPIFTFFLLFNIATFVNGQCLIDTSNIATFEFDNHTYEIVQENLNWANAAACAVERNGYLVEINSQQEQDTIYNAILNLGINPDNTEAPDGVGSYIWIGANDIATNGIWIWDGNNDGDGIQFWQGQRSGSPVSGLYNNWGDEPDFQDAVGIAITDWPLGIAGQWNDIFSTNQLYYIIEKGTQAICFDSLNMLDKNIMTTTIDFINEFEINEQTKAELNLLLTTCFPDTDYNGRTYFKQLPHYRLVMKIDNKVVGQLAIDYRAMSLNNSIVTVMGVIDLAIHPTLQGNGLGTQLVNELNRIATANKTNIDFLFLVTDKPLFYERLGYKKTIQRVSWLKINQGKNLGMGNEQVDDCFLMFKSVGNKMWTDGELDILGYWY